MPCASPLATYLLASLTVLLSLSSIATTTYPSELSVGDGRGSITATRLSKLMSVGLVDPLETPVILVVVMVRRVFKTSNIGCGDGIIISRRRRSTSMQQQQ